MTVKINKKHGKYNRSKRGSMKIKYVVFHYTGGTGSAKNNCIYFGNGNRGASADYFIDKDGSIWEYNDPASGYYSWHCGDGHGRYGITNANSIGVEVVGSGEAFTNAQINSCAALFKYLRAKFKTIKSDPVRHYDASRKSCPSYYVPSDRWNDLKAKIKGGVPQTSTSTPKPSTSVPGGIYRITASVLNVRSSPSTLSKVVATYSRGQSVVLDNWSKTSGGWVWGRYTGASSGKKRYIAVRSTDGKKVYAKLA